MELKVKKLKWSAGRPVAILNSITAKKISINVNERIVLRKGKKDFISVVDTADSKIVKEGEIAISSEIQEELNVREGEKIEIDISTTPKSIYFIKKKLDGKPLEEKEVHQIIRDIVTNSLTESEIALFISAMYKVGMSNKEVTYVIKALSKSGEHLKFPGKLVADKHCIGGIPGNRTTPLVVSICAAAGITMPKSSTRAITSASGTADTVETVAQVTFPVEEIKEIVEKTNACLVWGGSLDLVPADSKIIQIEKELKTDPKSELLASIMSKKLASGAKYILIDIPYGKNAKVNKKQALALKRKFEYFGNYFNKKLRVVLTKGDEPIGNGIGPVLEMIDIINLLEGRKKPQDLEKKILFLAGQVLEMTGKAKKGQGEVLAAEILYSGKALKKFKEIVKAQKGNPENFHKLKPGKFSYSFKANKNGRILEIDNKKINNLARIAGCPLDNKAGVYLNFHTKEKIKKGETILTVYSESEMKLKQAIKYYNFSKPVVVR